MYVTEEQPELDSGVPLKLNFPKSGTLKSPGCIQQLYIEPVSSDQVLEASLLFLEKNGMSGQPSISEKVF